MVRVRKSGVECVSRRWMGYVRAFGVMKLFRSLFFTLPKAAAWCVVIAAATLLASSFARASTDLNDDGVVDPSDMSELVNRWGGANGDQTGNGVVDIRDIVVLGQVQDPVVVGLSASVGHESIVAGETTTILFTAQFADDSNRDVTFFTSVSVTPSSAATIENGIITVSAGASGTVSVEGTFESQSATVIITVIGVEEPELAGTWDLYLDGEASPTAALTLDSDGGGEGAVFWGYYEDNYLYTFANVPVSVSISGSGPYSLAINKTGGSVADKLDSLYVLTALGLISNNAQYDAGEGTFGGSYSTAEQYSYDGDGWGDGRSGSYILKRRPGNQGDLYMVIDLSAGADAAIFPVSYLDSVPVPIPDEYKLSKILLRRIDPGTFMMGAPIGEPRRGADERQRQVTLTDSYYIGVFELTEAQANRIDGDFWYWRGQVGDEAVVSVSKLGASSAGQGIINRLNAKITEQASFPTEAQWEYACRAGTNTALYSGEVFSEEALSRLAHFGELVWPREVGILQPNAWGLYDMLGNAVEGCRDYEEYGVVPSGQFATNPVGLLADPSGGSYIGKGGGCGRGKAGQCRAASRSGWFGGVSGEGLRLVVNTATGNERPAAVFAAEVDGLVVSVDAAGSVDAEDLEAALALDYRWSWGDGGGTTAWTSSLTAVHTYSSPGTYEITLDVRDSADQITTCRGEVSVPGGTDGDFLVIDLSLGSQASTYPVTSLSRIPDPLPADFKTTKLVLRRVPAGTFTMGSPGTEVGHGSDEIQHQVTLSQDYYVGIFEVSEAQYELVMGSHPNGSDNGTAMPVQRADWSVVRGGSWPNGTPSAGGFIGTLAAKTGLTLDLPTEAQWEYACRAETTTALNSGDNLTDIDEDYAIEKVGRYKHGASGTAPVGSYLPNAFGLYDMHGNVWELCLDWYGAYSVEAQTNPVGPAAGDHRVMRGGSRNDNARSLRSASRSLDFFGGFYSGFRLVAPAQ